MVAAPEVCKEYGQQIVETEHLLKALLEQPNGLARRVISKAGSDASRLLDRVDAFIRRQPTVSGDVAQVGIQGCMTLCGGMVQCRLDSSFTVIPQSAGPWGRCRCSKLKVLPAD